MNRQLPQTQNRTFVYSYDGTNIVAQEVTNGTSLDYEYFFYDASGSPVGMNYLGNNYLFKKNLQGDIIEIWGTADGSSRSDFRKLVTYTYDAWGNITSMVDTTDNWYRVGTANPFRYRGYYYDNESGLYYLQSRYYDPVTGRFLNADDFAFLGSAGTPSAYNLFSYCENNHVNKVDIYGYMAITAGVTISVGTIIAFVAIASFTIAYLFDSNFRKAINQIVTELFNGLVSGVGYLGNVISEALSRIKSSWRYKGSDVHHIVAKEDKRAKKSREMLQEADIDINSKYNLVTIKKSLHSHLHTNSYHAAVELILTYCKKKHPRDIKNSIKSGLVIIAVLLKAASRTAV